MHEILRRIIERLGYTVCAVANRYSEALEFLQQKTPDLVLLDIGLDYSDKDGIDLANYINETVKIPFIYITANADVYTVNRAKITQPASYILKPFNEQSIYANIEIALFHQGSKNSITIRHSGKNILLNCDRIDFIKADNMYTEIHTNDGKKYIVRRFLKQMIEELPDDQFIQIHRSFVVNRKSIRSYSSEFAFIANTKIPIGESYRKFLNQA
jgi:DNA-binding LytR/AlgR family response regulator